MANFKRWNYYNTRATYLGYRFMELAFGKYREGHCSIEQLAEHLNVKVKHLPQLEDCLLKRATPLMAYVFDTNSFIVIGHYYPEQFPSFWEKFDQAVENGK